MIEEAKHSQIKGDQKMVTLDKYNAATDIRNTLDLSVRESKTLSVLKLASPKQSVTSSSLLFTTLYNVFN